MRTLIFAAMGVLAAGCFGGLKNDVQAPNIYRIDSPSLEAGP
jgi:hypothetical protein